MLAVAGYQLGKRFCFLDPVPESPAGMLATQIVAPYDDVGALDELARTADVVTYEFENVPASAARWLETRVAVFPPPAALEAAQRRIEEKQWFEKLGIATARYRAASTPAELRASLEQVGMPAVLKTDSGGYDGKGQIVVRESQDPNELWERIGVADVIVEEFVPFDRELSIIGVRGTENNTIFYPLIENVHANGILRTSVAPAPHVGPRLQAQAEEIARALLQALDYVGVLAVELFERSGRLLANEMAPRVHNSGHFSIDGSVCSQFENHVRAISGLPLGSTAPIGRATMFNLISELPEIHALLAIPGVRLHLYDKRPRPGRKLGHATLVDADDKSLERVRELVAGVTG